ncbi:hypothetical protein Bca4012_076639 [Brassica carinata]
MIIKAFRGGSQSRRHRVIVLCGRAYLAAVAHLPWAPISISAALCMTRLKSTTSPFRVSAPSWPPASSSSRSGKEKIDPFQWLASQYLHFRSLTFLISFKSTKSFVN